MTSRYLLVRVPDDLYERLQRVAIANRLSLHQGLAVLTADDDMAERIRSLILTNEGVRSLVQADQPFAQTGMGDDSNCWRGR